MTRPSKVRRFKDLDVWKNSKQIVMDIYRLSENKTFSRDYGRDQMRRVAVFIMSNIEGFERQSDKEFVRFLYRAKGSAGEVGSQLYITYELDYLDSKKKQKLQSDIEIVSRQLMSLIKFISQP